MNYAEMESRLITGIIQKIGHYVQMVRPEKTVLIAFDGVAPFAKMEQQRTRRYRSWFLENGLIENGLIENGSIEKKPKYAIYTSMFTPGTPFMLHLSKEVAQFFGNPEITASFGKTGKRLTYLVSGADHVGEGEHKVFEYLRNYSLQYASFAAAETVALYGLDADLIMLSIFHCNLCQNIFILREPPKQSKRGDVNQKLMYVDIKALCRGILKEIAGGVSDNILYIYDYVFLCFFLGNDFLPHFPSLNIRTSGITVLMDVYRKLKVHLIGKNRFTGELFIDWKNLGIFIANLASIEHTLILGEYGLRAKSAKRISSVVPINPKEREEYVNQIPLMFRAEETYIAPEEHGWQRRYYASLFPQSTLASDVCRNYLEGLEWVFLYYSSKCPHWRWKYHYAYPPLLTDLSSAIRTSGRTLTPIADFCKEGGKNEAFSPQTQLAYVLPRPYLGLLSEEKQVFLREKADYYPVSTTDGAKPIRFVWAYCQFFWEAHVLLPEIPLVEWEQNWV
jgi:5'-3' exonuclease